MDDNFDKESIVFDHHAIMKMLPHRYPFLHLDRIVHLDFRKRLYRRPKKCLY